MINIDTSLFLELQKHTNIKKRLNRSSQFVKYFLTDESFKIKIRFYLYHEYEFIKINITEVLKHISVQIFIKYHFEFHYKIR